MSGSRSPSYSAGRQRWSAPHSPRGPVLSAGSCGGFTIVEVAMTTFVLALAIVTSITTLQRAFSNLDSARNFSIAGNILQAEMEKERLLGWARVSDPNFQPTLDSNHLRNPAIAGRFTLSRTLVVLSGRNNQMVQVTLTVRWRSYDGRPLSRSFTTYFTQGGLNGFYAGQS